MADKMMRIAGRGFDNTAKAIRTNDSGEIVVSSNKKTMFNASWTWHNFPMAIHLPNIGKTFLGGVMRGGASSGHMLYTIDDETGDVDGVQLSSRFSGDDHNMVSLLNQPTQNRLVAFYTDHGKQKIYYRYINNYDIHDLSEEYSVTGSENSTYVNIHSTTASNPIFLFSRVGGSGLCVFVSQNGGETWTKKVLFSNATYYLDAGKEKSTSEKLGITLTGHGGTGDGAIYYGYVNAVGELCLPNGTVVANIITGENLPLTSPTSLKLVAENASSKTTVSSTNSYGHRLTFIDCPDAENFNTFNYKYAQYNSSTDSFDVVDIMTGAKGNLTGGSHAHYVGSCHDVGITEPIIYCSNYNEETREWEIWEFSALMMSDVSAGFGKSLLASDKLKLFRPTTILSDNGSGKPIQGLWLKGYYSHYRNYLTTVQTSFDLNEL